jgi:hypothetical protein|nr:hypothetical protein [uncultured Oscillibacter sp.]
MKPAFSMEDYFMSAWREKNAALPSALAEEPNPDVRDGGDMGRLELGGIPAVPGKAVLLYSG